MTHHFNPEVAAKLGVNAAIIVANLAYLQHNREAQGGEKYFIDGRWWVHHTYESLQKVHFYFSLDQLRRIMKKLLDEGAVLRSQPDSWNRDSYWSVAPDFMQSALSPDGSGEIAGSQAAKSPVVLHDNNIEHLRKTTREMEFDIWWDAYPKKVGKDRAKKLFLKLNPADLIACLEDDAASRYKGRERKYIPQGDTYLSQKKWEDEQDQIAAPSVQGWL